MLRSTAAAWTMLLATTAFAGELKSWDGAALGERCAPNVTGEGDAGACNDFLTGANNAMLLAAGIWRKNGKDILWCLPGAVNAAQVVKPILDLLNEKPEVATQPAIAVVYGAWTRAFPCQTSPPRR